MAPTALAALRPLAEAWEWQLAAACRGLDADISYHPAAERRSTKQRRIDQAKAICADCPVRDHCRRYALSSREPYGI